LSYAINIATVISK